MMIKSVMITGANGGIGRECARQLGEIEKIERVVLACRNREKAERTRAELERSTGRSIYEVLLLDVGDLESVRRAVELLSEPVDALVMNAGGMGGKEFGKITKYGVTRQFADNVLGHVALLERMIGEKKIRQTAIFSGSEAARGVPQALIKRPKLKSSSVEEFLQIMDGSLFGELENPMVSYGWVKFVGVLWFSQAARKYPELKIFTVSPGSTSGTGVIDVLGPVMSFLYNRIAPWLIAPLGMMHSVAKGAARYVEALESDKYESGKFYASKKHLLVGPLVDQASIYPDLADVKLQERAGEAIYGVLERTG